MLWWLSLEEDLVAKHNCKCMFHLCGCVLSFCYIVIKFGSKLFCFSPTILVVSYAKPYPFHTLYLYLYLSHCFSVHRLLVGQVIDLKTAIGFSSESRFC